MSAAPQFKLCWFDIPAGDVNRAKSFYAELFGWKFREFNVGAPMWMIEHEDDQIGGMIYSRGEAPLPSGEGFLPYFETKSLNETLERAQRLGAKTLVPPTLISETIGSFAVVQDTESNRIALYQSANRN